MQVALAALVVLRLAIALAAAPIGDEAYYWLWGQHPALSYFDHPPLHAWLQGAMSVLFGWSVFSLRLLAWLTSGVTIYLLYLWSRQLYGVDWERMFWIGAVAYFASPLFFIHSQMMFMDHLLIPLVLGSVLCFVRFFESWESNSPRWRLLYLAAFLLGLAALTKYNAVFVAVGVGLYVLGGASRRRLLLRLEFYGAALITLAVISPVIIWNVQNELASMNYNLVERQAKLGEPSLGRVRGFLLQTVIYLSPFLLWPLARVLLFVRPGGGFPKISLDLGKWVFLASTTVLVVVAAGGGAGAYWNIVAYLPLVPFIAQAIGARVQLALHYLYGFLLVAALGFNYAIAPVEAYFRMPDWESSVVHGWDQVEAEVALAEASFKPDFLVATRYTLAAQLAFARGRDDVTAISPRIDQFDYWWQPQDHIGQSALILTDRENPIDPTTSLQFETIEEVAAFDIVRAGRVINTFKLHLAEGYRGPQQEP